MNKKSVILSAGAISIIAIPSCCGAKKQASPNIVIIHCDQLAAWPLGCYGGDEVGTPNIDGLAAEGVVMTNFYANTPVSTPSRGCMMSGLYPNEHGAYKNDMQIRQDIPTFASELRDVRTYPRSLLNCGMPDIRQGIAANGTWTAIPSVLAGISGGRTWGGATARPCMLSATTKL